MGLFAKLFISPVFWPIVGAIRARRPKSNGMIMDWQGEDGNIRICSNPLFIGNIIPAAWHLS
jgi:hypothetical protein